MDKKLRLYAAEIIVASKLSKPAKLQLLEFIQHEATDTQVKALILDGKIVKLDEQAEEIVNERFEQSNIISEVDPASAYAGMLVIAGLGTAGLFARGLYKTYLSKAGRACAGTGHGEERQKCIARFKINAKIKALQQAIPKCKENKNPEKCKEKIQNKIQALQNALK